MRELEVNMPVPYEVHDLGQLLDLIKEEKVIIVGGWECAAGYVVLGSTIKRETLAGEHYY